MRTIKIQQWVAVLTVSATMPCVAASQATTQSMKNDVASINSQSKALKNQLDNMKKTMAELERKHELLREQEELLDRKIQQPRRGNHAAIEKLPVPKTTKSVNVLYDEGSVEDELPVDTTHEPFTGTPYGHTLLANIGGTAVITSPFINSRYDYKGSALIVNYSSINRDSSMLMQRRSFANQMKNMGFPIPAYPILELSGDIEGSIVDFRTFSGRQFNTIELSNAELDMQALAGDWFTGFMSFAYSSGPAAQGGRVFNSNLFLDNGFLTIGNFNKQPYYGTIGQVYVPFGQFDSYCISDPLNKMIFRTKARALTLGYQSMEMEGPYASIYAFQGPTRTGSYEPDALTRSRSSHINTFGANYGHLFQIGALSGLYGVSGITNVANSLGLQLTPVTGRGFGASTADSVLRHRVPGYDGRLELYYDAWNLIGEYSAAARSFSPLDMSFNGQGAKPSAYHLEAVYNFDRFRRPTNIAFGYGHSFESLAIGIPAKRMSITMNTTFWRNTLASLEFKHDVNYAASDTASYSDGPIIRRTGKIANAVTAHFDIFF